MDNKNLLIRNVLNRCECGLLKGINYDRTLYEYTGDGYFKPVRLGSRPISYGQFSTSYLWDTY